MTEQYNSAWTGEQIDSAVLTVQEKASFWNRKQEKLTGEETQIVGFDSSGDAIPVDAPIEIPNTEILRIWKGEI